MKKDPGHLISVFFLCHEAECDKVAEFNGKTRAESHDLKQTSHKPEDFIWHEFAAWFLNTSSIYLVYHLEIYLLARSQKDPT